MRKVTRADIVDYQTYNDERDVFRAQVMALKEPRRIHARPYLTFLFENTETVRYQIQEIMRTERIVREADILHEIETYNVLVGDKGELGCTLLIEIPDPAERDVLLRRWHKLPEHLYMLLQDGRKVRPGFDPAQVGDEKLSSVQYLSFQVEAGVPVALGADLPALIAEAVLTPAQQRALLDDLNAD